MSSHSTSRVAFATGKSVPTLKENASSVGLAGSFVDALFAFPSGEDQHAERALWAVKQKCTLLTFGWHLGKSGVVYPRLFGLDPGTCVEDEGEFFGLREAETDDEFIASIMFVWLVELSAVNGASMLSKDSDNSLAGRAHAAKQLMQYSEGMTFSAMRTFVLRNRIAPIGLMLAGRKWLYPAFEIARMSKSADSSTSRLAIQLAFIMLYNVRAVSTFLRNRGNEPKYSIDMIRVKSKKGEATKLKTVQVAQFPKKEDLASFFSSDHEVSL